MEKTGGWRGRRSCMGLSLTGMGQFSLLVLISGHTMLSRCGGQFKIEVSPSLGEKLAVNHSLAGFALTLPPLSLVLSRMPFPRHRTLAPWRFPESSDFRRFMGTETNGTSLEIS